MIEYWLQTFEYNNRDFPKWIAIYVWYYNCIIYISLIGAFIYFGILMLNSPSQLELHKNLNLDLYESKIQ